MYQDPLKWLEEADYLLEGVKAVVFNIKGTLTPISFEKDKLFPYLTDNLEAYLSTHYDEKETQADIAALCSLAEKNKEAGQKVIDIPAAANGNKEAVIKAVVENVTQQMNEDKISTELKQFQGHVWREAYKTKKVQAELFEDVAPVLKQLKKTEDFLLYIYSSETVELQKLMLANSTAGDISKMFTDFFDTSMGSKTEVNSYKNVFADIDREWAIERYEMLYLTDNPEEAIAADEAGWQAVLVDRSKQGGGIEYGYEIRQVYQVIEHLKLLFGEEDAKEDYGVDEETEDEEEA